MNGDRAVWVSRVWLISWCCCRCSLESLSRLKGQAAAELFGVSGWSLLVVGEPRGAAGCGYEDGSVRRVWRRMKAEETEVFDCCNCCGGFGLNSIGWSCCWRLAVRGCRPSLRQPLKILRATSLRCLDVSCAREQDVVSWGLACCLI